MKHIWVKICFYVSNIFVLYYLLYSYGLLPLIVNIGKAPANDFQYVVYIYSFTLNSDMFDISNR